MSTDLKPLGLLRFDSSVAVGPFIAASGRSWWMATFKDGTQVYEWQSIPVAVLKAAVSPFKKVGWASRWEEIDHDKIVALDLLCPNGMAGHIEAREPHTLFQFKVGVRGTGPKETLAHVIGGVGNKNTGHCICYSWEPAHVKVWWDSNSQEHHESVPGQLVKFEDNVRNFQYQKLGPLGVDNLSIRLT